MKKSIRALSLVIFRRFRKLGYHSYKEKAG